MASSDNNYTVPAWAGGAADTFAQAAAVPTPAEPKLNHVQSASIEWSASRPLTIGALKAFIKRAESADAKDDEPVDIEMGEKDGVLTAKMSVEVEVDQRNLIRRLTSKR